MISKEELKKLLKEICRIKQVKDKFLCSPESCIILNSRKDIKNALFYYTSFLNENYRLIERLWHFLYNFKFPYNNICLHCGNKTKFKKLNEGYHEFCSVFCAQNNKRTRKKYTQTCLKRYGRRGANHKGYKHKKPRSEEHRLKLSISRKEDARVNPNYGLRGKHPSKESIEKNRLSNQKTTCEKILSGKFNPGKYYKGGSFFSKKMNNKVIYRSSYEKKFYLWLEFCNEVTSYEVEKLKIPYFDKTTNINRFYIPDVLITWKNNNKDLIEIKPDYLKNDLKNLCKIEAAIEFIKEKQIDNFYVFNSLESFKYLYENLTVDFCNAFSQDFLNNFVKYTSNINKLNYL